MRNQPEWKNGTWWDGKRPITTGKEMMKLGLDPAGPDGRGHEIDEAATLPGEKWGRNIMYFKGEVGSVPTGFRNVGYERWSERDGREVQIFRMYETGKEVTLVGGPADERDVYIDGEHVETRSSDLDNGLEFEEGLIVKFARPRRGEHLWLDWAGMMHVPGGPIMLRDLPTHGGTRILRRIR